MKKTLFGAALLAMVALVPLPSLAAVDVRVSIPLPPLIVFPAPPAVIVIPETYVYFVPEIEEEIFFYDGWWWRPWQGRWYRSRQYNSGWGYYKRVPSFYPKIHSGWRTDYRDRRWKGHPWNFQPIPHNQLQQNWGGWKKNRHWERQQTWGVQGLQFRPRSRTAEPSRTVMPSQRVIEPVQPRSQPHEVRPPREVQPKPREAVNPQQSRPQAREVQTPREVKPSTQPRQSREGGSQRNPDRGEAERPNRR
ncbi:MAG: hypothetical protein C0390_00730 [Syntrophus sp. (in: bacteria)]|nr:hypothetical protein [Syntrophus sp. (in: bacteria)]